MTMSEAINTRLTHDFMPCVQGRSLINALEVPALSAVRATVKNPAALPN